MVGDLRTRTIRSGVWYAVARVWTQGISWAVTLVLAAWLTPGDYGLFAMALAFVVFLEVFQELGMGTAIIQRRDLTPEQVNAVFWIAASASFILMLIANLG